MTWSYSADQLTGFPKSPVYQVRLMIGDTESCRAQLQDEEIAYFIGTRSTLYGVAAECCRTLQARFSSIVDQSAGNTKILYSQIAKGYGLNAIRFEALSAGIGVPPYAGGISRSDVETREQNEDRVEPNFTVGMMDSRLPVPPIGVETEDGQGP